MLHADRVRRAVVDATAVEARAWRQMELHGKPRAAGIQTSLSYRYNNDANYAR
jgi:hypothetical protein